MSQSYENLWLKNHEFTFNFDKKNNIQKMREVVKQGYNFEFWIYDDKLNLKILKESDF